MAPEVYHPPRILPFLHIRLTTHRDLRSYLIEVIKRMFWQVCPQALMADPERQRARTEGMETAWQQMA